MNEAMKPVIIESWIESEAGWGIRPDGYSLHIDESKCKEYIDDYWKEEERQNPSGRTPHEYSRPNGNPKIAFVTEKLYQDITKQKFGLRIWEHEFNKLSKAKQIVFDLKDLK